MTRPALLIATAGGHLTQLTSLAPRLGIDVETAVWVTVPTSQSRSLLTGRDVIWAEYSSPRDARALAGHLALARRTIKNRDLSVAVSTGASLAPPFLLAARMAGVACHYIESATRVDGPSFSGRLASRIPGVRLYSQYESWAEGRWSYRGSVFDGWQVSEDRTERELRKAVVSVGSARGFPFERMLRAVRDVMPSDCEVVWQVLDASVDGLPGRVVEELGSDAFRAELESADIVISHAGTGSALTALELGLCPILIPRSAAHGEHVDDHQAQIAAMLDRRGLAVVRSPEQLTSGDLRAAALRSAHRVPGPAFMLSA